MRQLQNTFLALLYFYSQFTSLVTLIIPILDVKKTHHIVMSFHNLG